MYKNLIPGNIYWVECPKEIVKEDKELIHGKNRPFLCICKSTFGYYMLPISTSRVEKYNAFLIDKEEYPGFKLNAFIELDEYFDINPNNIISYITSLNSDDFKIVLNRILNIHLDNNNLFNDKIIMSIKEYLIKNEKYTEGEVISFQINNEKKVNIIITDIDEKNIYGVSFYKAKNNTYTKRIYIKNNPNYINPNYIYKINKNDLFSKRNIILSSEELENLKEVYSNTLISYSIGDIIEFENNEYIYFGLINNRLLVVEKKHAVEFPLIKNIPMGNYNRIGKMSTLDIAEIYKKIVCSYKMEKSIKKKLQITYGKYKKNSYY